MKFKEMPLAHEYCKGKGIELGAASHNPFGLQDCVNVAPTYDQEFFHSAQKGLCGVAAVIDFYGTAKSIPLPDDTYDYIISSHVVEHEPDLISAFIEWNRVLKKDGIIFMIFPKKHALPADIGRPISTVPDFVKAYEEKRTVPDMDRHCWVFDLHSMLDLIEFCNLTYNLNWKIIAVEQTDSKVGNGHTVVCRRK